MNNYNWPLANSNFTWLDRLKICKFFLTPSNFWTQNKYVKEYERQVAEYVGCKYAVLVSSGSTANQLICQKVKDDLIQKGEWPKRNKVILGAISWQTNASVWVREGFEPIFFDVNLDDFCFEYDLVQNYLVENEDSVACVFPTAVLGFVPNINKLLYLKDHFPQCKIALDCCENFFGEYGDFFTNKFIGKVSNICNAFTSSTSVFVAHQISTGQEGGFIFTNDKDEYQYFLLSRAHGMLRNLKFYKEKLGLTEEEIDKKIGNPLVHHQFDFQTLSSNYRSSDIAAYMGLLDFKRASKYRQHRIKIYRHYYNSLNKQKFYLPNRENLPLEDVAFCLPIISKDKKKYIIKEVESICKDGGIEIRSFISGNMLRQKPYQQYGDYKTFDNAEYLTKYGRYIGLNMDTTEKEINFLCLKLNTIWA